MSQTSPTAHCEKDNDEISGVSSTPINMEELGSVLKYTNPQCIDHEKLAKHQRIMLEQQAKKHALKKQAQAQVEKKVPSAVMAVVPSQIPNTSSGSIMKDLRQQMHQQLDSNNSWIPTDAPRPTSTLHPMDGEEDDVMKDVQHPYTSQKTQDPERDLEDNDTSMAYSRNNLYPQHVVVGPLNPAPPRKLPVGTDYSTLYTGLPATQPPQPQQPMQNFNSAPNVVPQPLAQFPAYPVQAQSQPPTPFLPYPPQSQLHHQNEFRQPIPPTHHDRPQPFPEGSQDSSSDGPSLTIPVEEHKSSSTLGHSALYGNNSIGIHHSHAPSTHLPPLTSMHPTQPAQHYSQAVYASAPHTLSSQGCTQQYAPTSTHPTAFPLPAQVAPTYAATSAQQSSFPVPTQLAPTFVSPPQQQAVTDQLMQEIQMLKRQLHSIQGPQPSKERALLGLHRNQKLSLEVLQEKLDEYLDAAFLLSDEEIKDQYGCEKMRFDMKTAAVSHAVQVKQNEEMFLLGAEFGGNAFQSLLEMCNADKKSGVVLSEELVQTCQKPLVRNAINQLMTNKRIGRLMDPSTVVVCAGAMVAGSHINFPSLWEGVKSALQWVFPTPPAQPALASTSNSSAVFTGAPVSSAAPGPAAPPSTSAETQPPQSFVAPKQQSPTSVETQPSQSSVPVAPQQQSPTSAERKETDSDQDWWNNTSVLPVPNVESALDPIALVARVHNAQPVIQRTVDSWDKLQAKMNGTVQ